MPLTITVSAPTATAGRKSETDPTWACKEPYMVARTDQKCPVWGDKVPYKSFTTIVDEVDAEDAEYSCEYVHGAESVSKTKQLPGGKVALRSDYRCW